MLECEKNMLDEKEINLFDIGNTLWLGKGKIISAIILTLAVSVSLYFYIPSTFQASTSIHPKPAEYFIQLISDRTSFLTQLENYLASNRGMNDSIAVQIRQNHISQDKIFNLFIDEYISHGNKIKINILQSLPGIRDQTKGLSRKDREQILIDLANKFDISKKKEVDRWFISYDWHDSDEAELILTEMVNVLIKRVHNSLSAIHKNEYERLSSQIRDKIQDVERSINNKKMTKKNQLASRISYLEGQVKIARELQNIKGERINTSNQLNEKNLEKNNFEDIDSFLDYPERVGGVKQITYKAGYLAIDEEIRIVKLQQENEEDQQKMVTKYFDNNEELLKLKNIRNSLDIITTSFNREDVVSQEWIVFDFKFPEKIKASKSLKFFVAAGIILGGMLGLLYIYFDSIIINRRNQKTLN